jgi:5-methyltetrahydrofolate corrinoid/iron sulfur protein methyltransferase
MIIVADNITTTRPSVRRMIDRRDADALAGLCRRLQAAGADWLDLNPGFVPQAKRDEVWGFMVQTAEASCDCKLMLDAPGAATLELALKHCAKPPVLNMATAQPESYAPIFDLAASHNLEVSAACITSTVPPGFDERLSLAALLVSEAAARGITGPQLILDPMVMPLGLNQGEQHARAVLDTLRAIPNVFDPKPRSMIALSNLYTKTAGVDASFCAAPFLSAAYGAGLDVVMIDVLNRELTQVLSLLQVFGGHAIFAPSDFR